MHGFGICKNSLSERDNDLGVGKICKDFYNRHTNTIKRKEMFNIFSIQFNRFIINLIKLIKTIHYLSRFFFISK